MLRLPHPTLAAPALLCAGLAFAGLSTETVPWPAPTPATHSGADELNPLDAKAASAATAAELVQVSRDAEAAGDMDRALWYAKLALGLVVDPKDEKAARARWLEVRTAVAAPEPDPTAALADSAKVLFGIATACESRKLYANAADVLNLLKGTAYDAEARGKLKKLFAKPQAIEDLLASGVPVEFEKRERLSKKEIAKLDATHTDWSNPLVLEGESYVLKTDMGYEMGRAMLDAMEQINKFYRKVFKLERKKTKKCVLHVYKDREEFDQYAQPGGEGVQGYYMPSTNEVHTYDHGTVDWLGREFLWSTLFHEASHQFTHEIWKLLIPAWLNEGTGSYFEGAELQAGGFVATNRIPDGRLQELLFYIGPGTADGATTADSGLTGRGPKLKDVLSYYSPGSYDGSYYPFGWGMVYFCRNYEDASSKRIYLPIYEDFMRSYVDGKGEKNAFKRFEQYFIHEAKIPGINTFEAFEQTWKAWIRDLGTIHYGGPEQAEVLVARGRKQLADGAPAEYAVDSFRWATEKDPNHAAAWLELGRAARKAKFDDQALYAYRRLLALALRRVDGEGALPHYDGKAADAYATALAEIKALDGGIERALRENVDKIVAGTLGAAAGHVDTGFPITALALLRDADLLLDGEGRIRARIQELVGKTGLDGRLARAVPVDAELSAWTTEDKEWKVGPDGAIVLEGGRGISTLRLTDAPPKVFRFEATVENTGALVGLLYNGLELDESYFVVKPGSLAMLVKYDSDPESMLERMREQKSPFQTIANFSDQAPPKDAGPLRIAIDVEHTMLRVWIDGQQVGTYEVPCEDLVGQVGLVVQGKNAAFRDVRILY